MNNEKLISIIVPSYNMEAYLSRNIESMMIPDEILRQYIEVIVVNDGSKDRTSEIAHAYEMQYPGNVVVIDKPNGHYGSCINAALPKARGCYVKIIDADDYVDPTAFTDFLSQLKTDIALGREADLLVTDWQSVKPDGSINGTNRFTFLPVGHFPVKDFNRLREEYDDILFGIHAIAYRRALFDQFAYHQTEGCCYTDTEWFAHPMAYVNNVCYIPYCVTQYLVGRDGQSMDPTVYARDIHIVEKIAFKLLDAYSTLDKTVTTEESRACFSRSIFWVLRGLYLDTLFGLPPNDLIPHLDLKQLDHALKAKAPDFYDRLSAVYIPTKLGRYYYIKDWRQRQSKYTWRYISFYIYRKIGKLKRRLFPRKK